MLLPAPGVTAVGVDNLSLLRLVLMSPWMSLAYVNYSLVYVHSMVSGQPCVLIIFAFDFLNIPLWPQWSEQHLSDLAGGLTLREDSSA